MKAQADWEIKMVIWSRCARGETDSKILVYFENNQTQYPNAPRTRATINKIRKEFSKLPAGVVDQAIKEAPELEALVEDKQILGFMVQLFYRAAFMTPFHDESSIDEFTEAIKDTYKALNTGVYTVDGIVRILPSWNKLKDEKKKRTVARIVKKLMLINRRLHSYQKNGEVKPIPNWPYFDISPKAANDMDNLRISIIKDLEAIYPDFRLKWIVESLKQPN